MFRGNQLPAATGKKLSLVVLEKDPFERQLTSMIHQL
jgi:hypothetical protein